MHLISSTNDTKIKEHLHNQINSIMNKPIYQEEISILFYWTVNNGSNTSKLTSAP